MFLSADECTERNKVSPPTRITVLFRAISSSTALAVHRRDKQEVRTVAVDETMLAADEGGIVIVLEVQHYCISVFLVSAYSVLWTNHLAGNQNLAPPLINSSNKTQFVFKGKRHE